MENKIRTITFRCILCDKQIKYQLTPETEYSELLLCPDCKGKLKTLIGKE